MLKKLLLAFLVAGSSVQLSVAQDPVKSFLKETTTELKKFTDKEGKRPVWRTLLERVTLGFYAGGKKADGSFDALVGAKAARDGVFEAAAEILVQGSVKSFLGTAVTKDQYDDYIKIFTKLGFDFVVRGIKYADDNNGTKKDLKSFLKEVYLPRFAKKMTIYWSLFAGKSLLMKCPYGPELIQFYAALQLIPFLGIIIEDFPEEVAEKIYDYSLGHAKKIVAKVQEKIAAKKMVVAPA